MKILHPNTKFEVDVALKVRIFRMFNTMTVEYSIDCNCKQIVSFFTAFTTFTIKDQAACIKPRTKKI